MYLYSAVQYDFKPGKNGPFMNIWLQDDIRANNVSYVPFNDSDNSYTSIKSMRKNLQFLPSKWCDVS